MSEAVGIISHTPHTSHKHNRHTDSNNNKAALHHKNKHTHSNHYNHNHIQQNNQDQTYKSPSQPTHTNNDENMSHNGNGHAHGYPNLHLQHSIIRANTPNNIINPKPNPQPNTPNSNDEHSHSDALSISSLSSLTPSPSPITHNPPLYTHRNHHTYDYAPHYAHSPLKLLNLSLVYAYIRPMHSTRHISSNITQLILLYFDESKYETRNGVGKQLGSFVWKLNTLDLLTVSRIDSIPFQIGSFLWYLSVYPYGIDEEHINFSNLYINIASPNMFDCGINELVINARLYCAETRSCWSSIKCYKSESDMHGWQKGALKITEITQFKHLTFIAYINILKIFAANTSPNMNRRLLYQYPLNISNLNKFVIKWKIDKALMRDLRSANEMKRFESDICHNMWVLGCVPNGIKKDNEASVFKIYLKLCALPPNISKIKVKFNILCIETKKHLKYIYNDFDYKHKYWQTDKLCKRSYLIFNDFTLLRFKAEIEIIELYDLHGQELSSNKWEQNIGNGSGIIDNGLVTTFVTPNNIIKLIHGFIRKYMKIRYDRMILCNEIYQFYPNSNGDLFTWNISCEQIIKLSQLNYKQRFDSKIFNISSLKWFLQIYPNGYRPEDEGFCSVYLILAYLPSILKEITIHFGVYCPQTMSNFSTIHTFNHSRDGRGTRRMLSLKHLRHLKDRNRFITFNCYINILKIKSDAKAAIVYEYPLQLTPANYKSYIYSTFQWNIDNEMMRKFKQCNNGQRFESKIFSEMWNLSIFPNNDKSSSESSENKDVNEAIVIGIRLCALPKGISKIRVKYRLECVQFKNEMIDYEWTHSAVFDYENYYVKMPKHLIKSSVINAYNELTFRAQIQITELFDLNGKIVKFSQKKK